MCFVGLASLHRVPLNDQTIKGHHARGAGQHQHRANAHHVCMELYYIESYMCVLCRALSRSGGAGDVGRVRLNSSLCLKYISYAYVSVIVGGST